MPPSSKARLTAKRKREIAAQAKLDGHPLWKCAQLAGYSNEASAATAIREYLRQHPPDDIEDKREIERQRLGQMRIDLLALRKSLLVLLARTHVVIQHGKVVGRFAGWAADPETGEVYHDADNKPIPTFEEIEDDDPSIRILAELRQNVAEQRKVSESLRRLDGMDAPVKIKFEDEDGLDEEIEQLVAELNASLAGPPPGHPG